MVLSWGDFVHLGRLGMSGDLFGYHFLGSVTGNWWVEATVTARHIQCTGQLPQEVVIVPKISVVIHTKTFL